MPATIFTIEDGTIAFDLVDTGAVGYLDSWQAPDGKTAATAVLADYDADATSWSCQVTSGMLSASANQNDVTTPATFCQPSVVTPQPGTTSYTLDLEFLQDINVSTGVSRYLFENDTEEAYFLLSLGSATDPPRAIGRVRLLAGAFGGAARENLTATVSLPLSRKPSIEFGTSALSIIVSSLLVEETGETVTVTEASSGSKSAKSSKTAEPVPA